MAKRHALGRGLAALLGEGDEGQLDAIGGTEPGGSLSAAPAAGTSVIDLAITAVKRNPRQPRRAIDPEALDELATSIAAVGIVQPVIVREVDGGYELVAGERRWRAAQKAGFTVIPAIVRKASDVESLELALVENVVRQQLNPIDEAYALKVLLEDLGVTQENLAARVGKSRSAIANKIRLLDLPAPVQEAASAGAISEGHARALLSVGERGKQLQLLRRIVEKGLSVRQVEEEARRITQASATSTRPPALVAPELAAGVREAFFASLGVVPRLRGRGNGGVIEIPFKDSEDLARMMGLLGRGDL